MLFSDGCACITVSNEGGPAVKRDEVRVAAKVHTCGECGCSIRVGERYEVATGLWDGEWSTFKTCLPCVRVRDEHFCDGWHYEEVRGDFFNAFGFDYCGEWPDHRRPT